jgi:hypothetical protein
VGLGLKNPAKVKKVNERIKKPDKEGKAVDKKYIIPNSLHPKELLYKVLASA